MKVGMRRFFVAGLAAFAGLALAAPSYAAFEIDVTEFGGPTIPIIDGGPLDQDGLANGVINVLTGALNPLLVNYSFTSLGGDSNALTGGGSDDASISQTGQVSLLTGGTGSITIVARETNFLFPSGGSGSMTTSASDTFRSTAAGAAEPSRAPSRDRRPTRRCSRSSRRTGQVRFRLRTPAWSPLWGRSLRRSGSRTRP